MTGTPAPSVARLTLQYSTGGAEIVDMRVVDAPPVTRGVKPSPDSEGAWIAVYDAADRLVGAVPLPDPSTGPETFDGDGAGARLPSDGNDRFVIVEVPYAGEGTRVEIHATSASTARDPMAESTSDGSLVARLSLDPQPLSISRSPDPALVVHAGWGAGNPSARTVLFLADGFTMAEMQVFLQAVERIKQKLATTAPFSSRITAMRMAHSETVSQDSGIGTSPRDTAFCGHFTVPRVIEIDQRRAAKALNRLVPSSSAVAIVIANTMQHGGSGGAATVCSLEPTWMEEIAIHELGHGWFGLADEYSVAGQPGRHDPVEANVCGSCERARLKWADLVGAAVALPTMLDSPPGVVGAFEGGKYKETGIFRPAFDCKMRNLGQPFCKVCEREIDRELLRHLPG